MLFPKHNTFFSFNTGDCEILNYKKDSKFNILNWICKPIWPTKYTNEFLSYTIYNDTFYDFLDKCDYDIDKGFLYVNLISADIDLSSDVLEGYLTTLVNITNVRVLIAYPSKLTFSNNLLAKIEKWSQQNYLIINTHDKEFVNILTNYKIQDTSIGSVGIDALDRQRIKRKCSRWVSGIDNLPKEEKDFILMNMVTSYLEEN